MTKAYFVSRVTRINRYFDALIKSFEIMIEGMDREEFLQFRMALLPASGFQSAQYRQIEIYSTDFIQLVAKDRRAEFAMSSEIVDMFEHIYWKEGATEAATGKKNIDINSVRGKIPFRIYCARRTMQKKKLMAILLKIKFGGSRR